jgi:hypothetical protein
VRYTETVAPSGPVLVAKGDRLPTPRWTATFSAQYRFAVAGAQAYIRGDYQYAGAYERSGSPETFSYDPTTSHQGATNYATMRTGAKFANWEVAAFINNVFNSQTSLYRYHDTVDSPGYRNFTFRPRTGGITVDYRF